MGKKKAAKKKKALPKTKKAAPKKKAVKKKAAKKKVAKKKAAKKKRPTVGEGLAPSRAAKTKRPAPKTIDSPRPAADPILDAIEADDLAAVTALLAAGPPAPDALAEAFDLDAQDAIKVALIRAGADLAPVLGRLVWAVTTGFADVVAAFLEAGDDVSVNPPLGTPLQVAASLGHASIVQLLLDNDADPKRGNAIGTPLSAAVEAGHRDCARLLLEAGADPLERAQFQAVEVLVRAADEGMDAVVEALIARGVDLEARGTRLDLDPESGRLHETYVEATALHTAARSGRLEIVRRLLDAGADRDAIDDAGKTALLHATDAGHDATAELLLQRGAPFQPHLPPELALMLAIDRDDQVALEAALTEGADPHGLDPRKRTRGATPLGRAAHLGRVGIVRRLLGVGADPAEQDPNGRAPVALAAREGHAEVLKILSDAGADLDAKLDGQAALHLAIRGGHTEAARVLVTSGARVDVRQPNGDTPLMLAVARDDAAAVRLLLDAGANPLLGNGWGEDVQALTATCATQVVKDLIASAVACAQG